MDQVQLIELIIQLKHCIKFDENEIFISIFLISKPV